MATVADGANVHVDVGGPALDGLIQQADESTMLQQMLEIMQKTMQLFDVLKGMSMMKASSNRQVPVCTLLELWRECNKAMGLQ